MEILRIADGRNLIRLATLSFILCYGSGCVADSDSSTGESDSGQERVDGEVLSPFAKCVRDGGKVLKSLPPRCITREGKVVTSEQTYDQLGADGGAGGETNANRKEQGAPVGEGRE